MIQQAYKYVNSSLLLCLLFFEWKISHIFEIKWVGTGKELVAIGTDFFKW